jgi:two-component system, OmpR family, phosphate regulon sensor histidine kinase PhoR
MKKLQISSILMVVAILAVAGFQGYWLKNNYDREKQNLDIRTMYSFRQTILQLQSAKLGLDRFNFDSARRTDIVVSAKKNDNKSNGGGSRSSREPEINIINLIQERLKDAPKKNDSSKQITFVEMGGGGRVYGDSSRRNEPERIRELRIENDHHHDDDRMVITYSNDRPKGDTANFEFRSPAFTGDQFGDPGRMTDMRRPSQRRGGMFRFFYNIDSLAQKDSVTIEEITKAYTKRLKEDKIDVGFLVNKLDSADKEIDSPDVVTIGFYKPSRFSLSLQDTFSYMFGKLKLPVLFSLLLVGITVFSFVLLYRNMLKQQRLAELKNEFISNITHELKTPIATVGVAIEALKSFNAIHDPERTKEYLDISQNELQRLNLLVDKVLKLSMFEKKEIELKYEIANLKDIAEEVIASMRLQTEKHRAQVLLNCEGDCTLQADRLHLLSVVFNLLDNALKYSNGSPVIKIDIEEKENNIVLKVADNGIGISAEYQSKVFDKFFRVPHGDTHNAKGYGLGLSYVAHVVKKHKGTISVESKPGEGTTFIISLPKQSS